MTERIQIGDPFVLNAGQAFGVVLSVNEKTGMAYVTFQNSKQFRDCELPLDLIRPNLLKDDHNA